ncbi:MAG: hypothetical protein JW990_08215, partial [Thermoleophilia bacterium]|nr:hypothetical protein [Thermoleophilia bacterium]
RGARIQKARRMRGVCNLMENRHGVLLLVGGVLLVPPGPGKWRRPFAWFISGRPGCRLSVPVDTADVMPAVMVLHWTRGRGGVVKCAGTLVSV